MPACSNAMTIINHTATFSVGNGFIGNNFSSFRTVGFNGVCKFLCHRFASWADGHPVSVAARPHFLDSACHSCVVTSGAACNCHIKH